VPLWDAQLAADEVRRTAEQGSRSVCFSEIPARLGLPSMYSGYWEPFFAACAETGTVINLHIGSSSVVHTTSEDAPMGVRISNHFGNSAFSLSDWLVCGAFIRHPQLKIAFSEGQAGWVPFLMSRLDGLWRAGTTVAGFAQRLPEAPSSYLKDHVYFCIFDDPPVLRFLDVLGDDNLCFETDYPHPDGSWPASKAAAYRQTATLTAEQRDKVLRTNAGRLYRIDRVTRASS
jgi:predicted TIM-barrel fold metal-dependent hydrolase